MHWYKNKPDWMSEQQWRSARTFVQTFGATVVFLAGDYLATVLTGEPFSVESLTAVVLIPAFSAAYAAISNRNKDM